jgi:hypothetical protein
VRKEALQAFPDRGLASDRVSRGGAAADKAGTDEQGTGGDVAQGSSGAGKGLRAPRADTPFAARSHGLAPSGGIACRAGSAAFLLLAVAAPAAAQLPPPQPRIEADPGMVVNDPTRVFGDDAPVFAPLAFVGALGLSTSASLVTTYSDNVARVGEDEPLPTRFRSKDDWTFRPTLGVGLERPIGNHRLFASGSLGRVFYAQNSQLNSNRLGVSGGADLALGRSCGGQLVAAWNRRDTQLGTFEEVFASRQSRTTFGANASCATVTGLTGSLGYNNSKSRNSSDDPSVDRSFADVNSQNVTGSIGYRIGQRGQAGISASWAENIYPNQLVDGEENANEVKSFSLFGSYRIGNTLRANGSIGRTEVTSTIPGSVGFSGVTWSLGTSYSGPRVGANIGVGQSVNGGNGGSANYSITRFLSASATYRLNDRMSAAAGYSYGQADFRGIDEVPETEAARSNTDHRLFIGADYRLNRFLRLGLDLNHQTRSSDPSEFGFKVNSASLSIGASF